MAPDGMRYTTNVPKKIPLGKVLVHNHIRPEGFGPDFPPGWSGFRAWFQNREPRRLVRCKCGWAPDVRAHYRIKPELLKQPPTKH